MSLGCYLSALMLTTDSEHAGLTASVIWQQRMLPPHPISNISKCLCLPRYRFCFYCGIYENDSLFIILTCFMIMILHVQYPIAIFLIYLWYKFCGISMWQFSSVSQNLGFIFRILFLFWINYPKCMSSIRLTWALFHK